MVLTNESNGLAKIYQSQGGKLNYRSIDRRDTHGTLSDGCLENI